MNCKYYQNEGLVCPWARPGKELCVDDTTRDVNRPVRCVRAMSQYEKLQAVEGLDPRIKNKLRPESLYHWLYPSSPRGTQNNSPPVGGCID